LRFAQCTDIIITPKTLYVVIEAPIAILTMHTYHNDTEDFVYCYQNNDCDFDNVQLFQRHQIHRVIVTMSLLRVVI